MRAWALSVAVLGLLLTACAGSSDPTSPTGGIPARVRAQLLERALRTAREGGDPHPYNIEAVRTTTGQARVAFHDPAGPEPAASRPVYLVAMQGLFTTPIDFGPPHTPEITTVIYYEEVIGRDPNGQGATMGEGGLYPELNEAGTPVHLGPS
jgi:hypothetical protein